MPEMPINSNVRVLIKREAHGAGLPLPTVMTAGSAGMDLCAAIEADQPIGPGEIKLIPTGFCWAIPPGYEGQVRPRSGLASKHGLTLINSPGTIDSDYRGEVKLPLINHGNDVFVITRGMRIAQMIIAPVPYVTTQEVAELGATERGSGGFGHTGIHDKK